MSLLLSSCATKAAVDLAIRNNLDCVVVLRFGQAEETTCLKLDEIVSSTGYKVSVSAAHWANENIFSRTASTGYLLRDHGRICPLRW